MNRDRTSAHRLESRASAHRNWMGNESVHWRYGTVGSTLSTKWAAILAARRAQHNSPVSLKPTTCGMSIVIGCPRSAASASHARALPLLERAVRFEATDSEEYVPLAAAALARLHKGRAAKEKPSEAAIRRRADDFLTRYPSQRVFRQVEGWVRIAAH